VSKVIGLDEEGVNASRYAAGAGGWTVIRGDHEDDGGSLELLDAACYLCPAELWQVQVHHDQLRGQGSRRDDGLAAADRSANDQKPCVSGKQFGEGA